MTAIAESRPVAARYSLDRGVGRYRIGLIVLASDNTIERDFMNMRPSDEVAIFASRILNANPCTLENLRTMAPRITEATALLIPMAICRWWPTAAPRRPRRSVTRRVPSAFWRPGPRPRR